MEICKRGENQRFLEGKGVIVKSCPNIPALAFPDWLYRISMVLFNIVWNLQCSLYMSRSSKYSALNGTTSVLDVKSKIHTWNKFYKRQIHKDVCGLLGSVCYAKSLQSCPTLCDSIDGSPPGSPIPGILQARTLEWAAIFFSNAWKWKVKVKSLSRVRLLVTPWIAA